MKFIYFDLLEEIDFCNSGPVYCMGLYIPNQLVQLESLKSTISDEKCTLSPIFPPENILLCVGKDKYIW